MWPSLMQKAKDGGLNAIETYVFWNAHEPSYREYDFSGNLDLIRFLATVRDAGLYAILRIGPYVCAEWNYGGFPVWLHNLKPNITLRTTDDTYMDEMKTFTTKIVDMVKQANMFAPQGGHIILAQIENEFGNIISDFGDEGKEYIKACADFANSLDVGVPWIMCQQQDAPSPMIETCNGFYCDAYSPKKSDLPKFWTENWTGWFKAWGDRKPYRTAEDVAFSVARFFQNGGSLQNYYMYHGGTNFGRTTGGPYITTSYDYDAPLDEYGNVNQPKWGHLKQLHELLISAEKILTNGVRRDIDYGDMMGVSVYEFSGQRFCFFGNANDQDEQTFSFEGNNFTIPAWSVSMLPNCSKEVYNTAKVNTQKSIMVKKSNEADQGKEPFNLQWTWLPEYVEKIKKPMSHSLKTKVTTYVNKLLEQKAATNDTTDYLWYLTSVNINGRDKVWNKEITLQVNTKGHVLHAFVNGQHIGSQWGKDGKYDFKFEKNITLTPGNNSISLLSVTVGLKNYGAYFDKTEVGVVGPVKLISSNVTMDLSNNSWAHKVGLHGEVNEFYQVEKSNHLTWNAENLPTNRMFTWYKTTFQSPLGEEPVVLDLMGLGKGTAWVNGNNIGRFWPTFNSDNNGCSPTCDYRGKYDSGKCVGNCGKPSQRWYHVPRSYLRNDGNTLILFEEIGGNPSGVTVNTVTVGSACGNAYEGSTLELSCQGARVISDIKFASFGDPIGTCGSFATGSCESPNSKDVLVQNCLGKQSCSVNVTEWTFDPSGCQILPKRLAVEAIC
ncbi:beta-galactosidase 7-like [Cornus florida]|uniref:beta-galactosidase 7-like n=1 Tax=Cornus florida TaxID=4283 RepID=UPI00289B836E|nr:beta-galactosidase 7-like [Cornus florida]